MMRKTGSWFLITMAGIFTLVFLMSFGPVPSSAELVWSDDFNDGNLDGWTVNQGNFSVDNGVLNAIGDWNEINHPSSIAYGTWSFDLYPNISTTPEYHSVCRILFISRDIVQDSNVTVNYYDLILYRDHFSLLMYNWTVSWAPLTLDYYYPPSNYSGWLHFDITRDTSGLFNVYLNGSRIMECKNERYTLSDYFYFYAHAGILLDNIVVSDTIDVFPPWYEIIPWSTITPFILGIGSAIICLAFQRANLEERTLRKLTLLVSSIFIIGGLYWLTTFMLISIEYSSIETAILGISIGGVAVVVFSHVAYVTWKKMKSDNQNLA